MSEQVRRGSDLLLFLHALVGRDPAIPGFRGRMSVGVREPEGTTWWRCAFLERAQGEFVETAPDDVDVEIRLTDEEANGILEGQKIELGSDNIVGDRRVFSRFVHRYL